MCAQRGRGGVGGGREREASPSSSASLIVPRKIIISILIIVIFRDEARLPAGHGRLGHLGLSMAVSLEPQGQRAAHLLHPGVFRLTGRALSPQRVAAHLSRNGRPGLTSASFSSSPSPARTSRPGRGSSGGGLAAQGITLWLASRLRGRRSTTVAAITQARTGSALSALVAAFVVALRG